MDGKAQSTLTRSDFEGLKDSPLQAWDIAFCQMIDKVADEVGLEIVRLTGTESKSKRRSAHGNQIGCRRCGCFGRSRL